MRTEIDRFSFIHYANAEFDPLDVGVVREEENHIFQVQLAVLQQQFVTVNGEHTTLDVLYQFAHCLDGVNIARNGKFRQPRHIAVEPQANMMLAHLR